MDPDVVCITRASGIHLCHNLTPISATSTAPTISSQILISALNFAPTRFRNPHTVTAVAASHYVCCMMEENLKDKTLHHDFPLHELEI